MAKAIFQSDFNYSSRKVNAGWAIKASKSQQSFPAEVIEAAVAVGVAVKVEPKATTTQSK